MCCATCEYCLLSFSTCERIGMNLPLVHHNSWCKLWEPIQ